jgi:hypothetical protein
MIKSVTSKRLQAASQLANLPLLRATFADRSTKIVCRSVDSRWFEERVIPRIVSGFNPSTRSIFINQESGLNSWIQKGMVNDRKYNDGDYLVRSALFLIHDALHVWGYRAINHLCPEIKFGSAKITDKNFDDFVFLHLMTEAVATVGLDYWYLSTFKLSKAIKVGTSYDNLTVSYSEEDLNEYRLFNEDFVVQDPNFFTKLCTFYITGEFIGFDLNTITCSAIAKRWLAHELQYGENQRQYTVAWFNHFSNQPHQESVDHFSFTPGAIKPWWKKLMKDVGQLLWKKIKENVDPIGVGGSREAHPFLWQRDSNLPTIDFRFTNFNRLTPGELKRMVNNDIEIFAKTYFMDQFISAHEFKTFPIEYLSILKLIRKENDYKSLMLLFRDLKVKRVQPLSPNYRNEPRELFFLN